LRSAISLAGPLVWTAATSARQENSYPCMSELCIRVFWLARQARAAPGGGQAAGVTQW
jgi:hypothetical protein